VELTIVGGRVVMGGRREAAEVREAWIRKASMTAIAAIVSTMGTALEEKQHP
jgi:hypothetical protein